MVPKVDVVVAVAVFGVVAVVVVGAVAFAVDLHDFELKDLKKSRLANIELVFR